MNEPQLQPVTDRDHIRGPADAPVTVVEYGDYECPFCRGAARDVADLRSRHAGQIRFVFRNFPITELHPHAEQAAEAAEAAGAQGKFWQLHDALLNPGAQLDYAHLVAAARALGLDVERFERDLANRTFVSRVEEDFNSGMASGVNGTPKFYVNGQRIDGRTPLEHLGDAIEAALDFSGRSSPSA